MKQIAPVLLVLLALVLVDRCGYSRGARTERLRIQTAQTDASARVTDSMRVDYAHRESTAVARALRAEHENATQRETIARLNQRVRLVVTDSAQVLLLDSLSNAYEAQLARTDSALTIWKALAAERGEIGERCCAERDQYREQLAAWKRQAERPRFTYSDIGGGLLAGYGAAERNETLVLAGSALVVVPRLLGALGRLF